MKKLLFVILVLAFNNLALAQLNESFEGNWLPFDWTVIDNDGGYAITETFLNISAHSGTHGARATNCHDDYLITPKLLPTVGDNTFGYWARCEYSSYSYGFEIMVSNTGTAIGAFVQIADYPNFNTATWTNQTENLSAYNGQEIYVAIHVYSTPFNTFDFGFDDITGPALFVPSCQHPSAQTEINISTVSADLGWTENGTATAWEIEWGPSGFAQGSGTLISTTSNPHNLTGLTDTTTYDWYVRADCGGGDVSTWVASTFVSAQATPFNEPFTNTDIPDHWSMYDPDDWNFSTNAAFGAAAAGDHTPGGGTQYAWVDGSNGQANGFTLETPLIDPGNLTTPQFSFWYFSNNTNNPGENNLLYCEMSIDGGSWANIFTYSGDNPSWEVFTHDLSSYTITASVKFRFIVDKTAPSPYYNDILIDDVAVGETPPCPNPSAQTTTNITGNSVNLNWTENGTATTWQIEWGPNGFTQGNGAVETVALNPYNLSGLLATTSYDWYVRADCGGGDYGTWMGPCTFTTPCVSVTIFPWIENFDAIAGTPNCWTNNSTQEWGISDFLQSFGAYHDHTTNSGNFASVDDSPPYSCPTNLDTPPLDVTSLTTPILTFWYWIGRDTQGSLLYIDVFDGISWTEGIDTLLPHNGWIKDTVNLSAYSSVATQIRFRGMENMNYSNCDICIDDVSVDEIASCAAPTALADTNITLNSASLSWTENGTANTWDIEWGTAGFSQGNGTIVTGSATNPHTLSGLSSSTTYDWYVRADCGGGDFSLWEGPDVFTTTCDIVPLPIIQGFNAAFTKDCWTETIVVNTGWWPPGLDYVPYGVFPWCEPYEGDYMVEFNSNNATDGNEIRLESPEFSTSGMTAARVMFAWHEYYGEPSPYEGVTVQWSLDGVNWNNGGFYPRVVGYAYGWSEKIYNLPAGALGQSSVYVGFLFHSSSNYNCYLDDVTIEETPPCLDPSVQTVTYITTTSAKLGWTETGSANTWEIEWGQTGFTQGNGTTLTGIVANPYLLDGLIVDNTYDWYVRADCGGGLYSDWSGPNVFTATCGANNSYPWEENFEGEFIPGCWSKTVTTGNDITQSTAQNHTTSGSSSARFSSSSASSDYNQYLFTGQHLIDYNYGQLTFWHRKENTDTELLEWGIATTTNPDDFTWTSVPLSGTEWQETSVYIGNYCYQTVYIGFHYYGNNSEHVYLDDISIDAVPTCPAPSFQTETYITDASAKLGWTANGTAGIWEIEWGPAGFIPGNGTVVSTSDNPYQLIGLSSSTTYDWYIRSDCGGDFYSYRVGPGTFATPCPPVSIPYSEDFDSGIEWPSCWAESGDDVWGVAEIDGATGYSAWADYNNSGQGYLYSPQFDGTGKTDLHVKFFTHWEAWYPNQWQDAYFYGSPDGGTTQILLEHWSHLNPASDEGWKQYDISSWADGASNIVFWWEISMVQDRFWLIDDFGIQEGSFGTHGLWTGAINNDWHTGSNWDDGLVPDTYSNVVINPGLVNYPTIASAGAKCNNIIFKSNISGDASLIDNGNLIVNGSAKVERYIPQYTGLAGWHYISSPVSSQAVQTGFVADPPTSNDDFYFFNEATNYWTNSKNNAGAWNTNFDNSFIVGKGYMVAYCTDVTKTFTGVLNNTSVSPSVSYTVGQGDGWNLVGNPFPCAIDWDDAGWTKTNISGSVYIYDGTAGQYKSWNGTTGDIIDGIVPPMNGIFVKATGASPVLTIPLSARTHGTQSFYKNGKQWPTNLLHIEVAGNGHTDKTFIHFRDDATNGWDDDLDAYKLKGIQEAPQLYSFINDFWASINSKPFDRVQEDVLLGMEAGVEGDYNLSVSGMETFAPAVQINLYDLKTGAVHNFRNSSSYRFYASPEDDARRFKLIFYDPAIEDGDNNGQDPHIYISGDKLSICFTMPTAANIEIFNINGQLIFSGYFNTSNTHTITLNDNGFFIIRIGTEENVIIKKTINI